ncbi:MAG TPA: DUF5916 domain-containing protein [Saprospiraceae bacterium]|nr:DUF5916 domain-containing protein [Saprospiraceae bacterium]
MRFLFALFTLCFFNSIYAQQPGSYAPKKLVAQRIQSLKTIDGIIGPSEWNDVSQLDSFVEFRPKPGDLEETNKQTTIYLGYNDEGIFVAGKCREAAKEDISSELAGRDGFGNNDFVGIIFDTYLDNQNGFEYFVTPLNEQMDAKVSPSVDESEDFSWNAVWQSATSINENEWHFEIFIPFSAIRFSNKNIQDWGLNVTRRRVKTGEQYMWNPVWPTVNGFLTQEGHWTGLQEIKPPLRLQFSPYLSFYSNHYPTETDATGWNQQINGGMDVKWGINQAFTLDATLIPDFGQVQSDNQVLNLTPFEVRFNENRPFFTEGIELFNKGNFFYSRRIGGTPYYFNHVHQKLRDKERILSNPIETRLINASKISGRTENGMGIAFLNALTAAQYATIENMETREQRQELTDPLTNFNVLVVDQTLKNNSSISFVNTSVLRRGDAHEAIVTSVLFDLNDNSNTWNIGGKVAASQLIESKVQTGYSHLFYVGKKSGRFNFNLFQELTDTKFTSNDLGYFTNNNFINHGLWLSYRWVNPGTWYNRININGNFNVSHLYKKFEPVQKTYQSVEAKLNFNGQLKNLWWAGIYLSYKPESNDFYEPRQQGKYFRDGKSYVYGGWFETNNNKMYYLSAEFYLRNYISFYDRLSYDANIFQSIRFNSKTSISLGFSYQPKFNNIGFSGFQDDQPYFARRNINTVVNTLSLKYNFTNRMGLTARIRHYTSTVTNKAFYLLNQDGSLNPFSLSNENPGRSADYFNIDLVYTWQFAQGSFINLVWKNAISQFNNSTELDYFHHLDSVLSENQNNNLSLKIIYFLDYQQLKPHRM